MDQMEYYSPCFNVPCVNHYKMLNFEKKYNLKFNGLINIGSVVNGLTLLYKHLQTDRLFSYNIGYNDWEECG